jgi:hypothetical protein
VSVCYIARAVDKTYVRTVDCVTSYHIDVHIIDIIVVCGIPRRKLCKERSRVFCKWMEE